MPHSLLAGFFATALSIALSLIPVANVHGAGKPGAPLAEPKPASQAEVRLVLNGPSAISVPEDTPLYGAIAQYDITIENIPYDQDIRSGFVLDGEDGDKYSIDPDDGTLYPTKLLDFESDTSDAVTVTFWLDVADKTYQDSIDVAISIEDVEEPVEVHKVLKANPVPGVWSYGGHALSIDPPGFVETEWANWGTILRIEVISETHDPNCGDVIECVTISLGAAESGDEQELVAMRSLVRGDLFVAAVKLVEKGGTGEEREEITWGDGVLRELELLQVDEEDEVLINYGSSPKAVGVENEPPEFAEFEPEHGAVVDDEDVDFGFVVTDSPSMFPEPEDYPDHDGDQNYTPVAALVHVEHCAKSIGEHGAVGEVRGLNLAEGPIFCDGQPNFHIIANDGDFDEIDKGLSVDTEIEFPGPGTHYVTFVACDRAGNCAAYDPDESSDIALVSIRVAELLDPVDCDHRLRYDTTILGTWESGCLSKRPAVGDSGDRYAHFFHLVLELESVISVELHSKEEPYLYLLSGTGTDGDILAETDLDDSSLPAGARVERTLAAGQYTIEATTYASEASGEFVLTVKGIPTTEQEERAALTALYNATAGDNWHARGNWLTDAPLSEWHGVSTGDSGRVIWLGLSHNGLAGDMPSELGLLDRLEGLLLGGNELTGEIPSQLGELDNLRSLSLAHNRLSGAIPSELQELDDLLFLFLDGNQLTGEIPPELARLSELDELNLSNNKLTGEIPPEFARSSKLRSLWLGGNQLSGSIPPELVGIAGLKGLGLSDNELTGSIPVLLSYLPKLAYLELDNNRLEGDIPYELVNLSYLSSLTVTGNELSGCIPESLLEVDENDLTELGLPFCEGPPGMRNAAPISDSFGTFREPVPLGTPALAASGVIIEVSTPILEATEVVENWEEWAYSDHEPPSPGNKYIIAHLRAEYVSGIGHQHLVSPHDFGVVRSSGQAVGTNCSGIFGGVGRWVDKGEVLSSILCFQIPVDEEFPQIYYNPQIYYAEALADVLGFWALTEGKVEREEVEPGTPISDSYGTRENPVPFGEKALAADGYALIILSVELDAEDMVEDWHENSDRYEEYRPPAPGNRYVVIEARAENIEGSRYPEYGNTNGFLNLVTSSGKVIEQERRPCSFAPENLGAIRTFEGGLQEGYVCFEVPDDELELTLYYENGSFPRRLLGFWALSEDIVHPVLMEPATAVSEDYGTRENPVPLGSKALASDGIALTVIRAELDATALLTEQDPDSPGDSDDGLIKPGSFGPPRPGHKYVIAVIRVEGAALNADVIQYPRKEDFGLITASGLITERETMLNCDGDYGAGPYINVFNGAYEAAALCYEIPVGSSGLNLFYAPRDSDEVLGFWALSDDETGPVKIDAATPISNAYGGLAWPVPLGERAATKNGLAISIVSYMVDLSEVGEYPIEGRKTVVVRARIEDIGGEGSAQRTISGDDFGVVGSSGTINAEYTHHRCPINSSTWDQKLYGEIFGGGWQEGFLCFGIPVEESAVSIFYEPSGPDGPLGYWEVTPPLPPPGASLISDGFGTLSNPVPFGEGALAGNGIDITVLSATSDANDIRAEDAGLEELSAAPGNRFVIVRVRAVNTTGFDGGLVRLWARDFGLVTSSGLVIPSNSHAATRCDVVPDRIKGRFLGDRTLEGNLCFQVPIDEDLYGMFYAPRFLNGMLGVWQVAEDVSPPEGRDAGTAISAAYGTRTHPVPIGEKAVTSDGTAIAVISVETDPEDGIVPWSNHHQPQEEGVEYILIRTHIENDELGGDALLRLHRDDFGVVSSSGHVIFRDERYRWNPGCESVSREVHESVVFRGGFAEADLCFKVPGGESGWTLFYSPGDVGIEQGFWALSEEEPEVEPVPEQMPDPISDSYGSWRSPVPLGDSARASNGVTVTILDLLEQDEFIEIIDEYYPLPLDGKKYVAVRVRIENFTESENELLTVTHDDFGALLSPGKFVQAAYHPCGTRVALDIIIFHDTPGMLRVVNLFMGGEFEGYLCFQVPIDETAHSIFYRPGWASEDWPGGDEPALGFWSVLEGFAAPEPTLPGTPVSDTYGTLDAPVPSGEKAVASDGIAITVVSAELDATETVEGERAYDDPPDEGNRFVLLRVRVENATDRLFTTLNVRQTDFGIATASETFRVPFACGQFPDPLELRLFGGMAGEANLCFEVPANETALTLIYQPGQRVEYTMVDDERSWIWVYQPPETEVLGYWEMPSE